MDHSELMMGQSGGCDWLQRWTGGGAFSAAIQSPPSCCRCCPLLDRDGGDFFVVEAFNTIVEVVHFHVLHLDTVKNTCSKWSLCRCLFTYYQLKNAN